MEPKMISESLIRVSEAKPGDLPLAVNSIYKFHSLCRYPTIILKVGGKLFFDMDAWNKEIERVRSAQVKRAEDLRRGGIR